MHELEATKSCLTSAMFLGGLWSTLRCFGGDLQYELQCFGVICGLICSDLWCLG